MVWGWTCVTYNLCNVFSYRMESSNVAKCKFKFHFCVQSLSMVFSEEFSASTVDMVPVVVTLSKREHHVTTQPTNLLPGKGTMPCL